MKTIYFIKGGMQSVQQNAQHGIETEIEHGSPEWAQNEHWQGLTSSESFTGVAWAEDLERLTQMSEEWAKGHGVFNYRVSEYEPELN